MLPDVPRGPCSNCSGAEELVVARDEPEGERRRAREDREANDFRRRRHGHGQGQRRVDSRRLETRRNDDAAGPGLASSSTRDGRQDSMSPDNWAARVEPGCSGMFPTTGGASRLSKMVRCSPGSMNRASPWSGMRRRDIRTIASFARLSSGGLFIALAISSSSDDSRRKMGVSPTGF